MAELALKAAPRGNRSGLALTSDDVRTLVVVVLPKPWRASRQQQTYRLDGSSDSALAVIHEGDRLVVGRAWAGLATELVDRGTNPDQDTLFGLTTAPSGAPDLAPRSLRELGALVGLVRRVDPTTETVVDVTSAEDASYAMAQARLVHEVESVAGFVRQGYRPLEERLSVVRGRIVERDLIRAQARGDTSVLCRFDDLTPGTPLQRVVVTALERCAEPTTHVDALVLELLGDVAGRAQQVRRLLRDIPALTAVDALRTARRLTVSRPEQRWRAAFEAARDVLQHAELSLGTRGRAVPVRRLAIRTDSLWETMLERAARVRWPTHEVVRLQASSGAGVVEVYAPWIARGAGADGESFPDLLVVDRTHVWCGDAKYKLLDGGASRDDLYQMFAYSHLTRTTGDGRGVTRAALLHPAGSGQSPGVVGTLVRRPGDDLELDVAVLPWPSPEECRSGLDAYIRRLAGALPELGRVGRSADDAEPTVRQAVSFGLG